MISIDRYLVFEYNITELLDICNYRQEVFLSCGIVLLVNSHLL